MQLRTPEIICCETLLQDLKIGIKECNKGGCVEFWGRCTIAGLEDRN